MLSQIYCHIAAACHKERLKYTKTGFYMVFHQTVIVECPICINGNRVIKV